MKKLRIFQPVSAFAALLLPLAAPSDTATWIGGTGNWTDATKWSTGIAPATPEEGEEPVDVVIDGDEETDSVVSLRTGIPVAVGQVAVTDGDTLAVSKNLKGNLDFSFSGLDNAGTLQLNAAASEGNSQTTTLKLLETGFVNRNGGYIAITNAVGNRNRIDVAFESPANSTNDGTINLWQNSHDQNDILFRFTSNGTFLNNGQMYLTLSGTENPARGTGVLLIFNDATSDGVFQLLGTGKIILSMDEARVREGNTGYVRMSSNTTTLAVTNGPQHTIEGSGTIEKFGLANAGLVRACGTNWFLTVQGSTTASGVKPLVNMATGRMVAYGPGGLYLGANSTSPSRVVNEGLLEARASSFIAFRSGATQSTTNNKSYIPATFLLGGTFAGGGEFRPPRPLQLTADATLSPGDLANTDGTGASTAGTLTFTTNLVLSAGTTLDFQFGRCEAGQFDAVVVDGALTLAGTLRVSALGSATPSGTYRIFTCTPGELTGDDTSLDLDVAEGLPTPVLRVDAAAGTVDAYFPDPSTVILFR